MKTNVGSIAGLVFAAMGIVIGLYFAWRGFASMPYDGRDLGIFSGLMGAVLGCICACIGTAVGYWSKNQSRILLAPSA